MSLAFYMDHHVPRAITLGLRLRRVDVLTAYEDGTSELDDAALLDRASALGRVLFTRDDDLLAEAAKRQRAGIPFHGIIYAHRSGIDGGLGQHATTQEHGNLVGIDFVVLRFATVDRFHIERVPQDKRHPCLGTQVSQPVPGEDTFNRDHHLFTIGGNGLEQRLRAGGQMAMHHDVTVLVQDANVHAPGVQVDATIELVLLGVESHEVSSSSIGCLPNASSPTVVCRGRGLNKYQATAADAQTAVSRSAGAVGRHVHAMRMVLCNCLHGTIFLALAWYRYLSCSVTGCRHSVEISRSASPIPPSSLP